MLSLVSLLLVAVTISALGRVVSRLDTSRPLPEYVAATNQGDAAALEALLVEESQEWLDRSKWLAATGAELSLTSCTTDDGGLTACNVRFGNGWFYNRAAPPEVARGGALGTVISVEVAGNRLRIIDFPLPDRLTEVEEPFRQWALRTHPGSAPRMWDTSRSGVESQLRIDAIGGAAHQVLLDEYVEYVSGTAQHSPG